MSSPSDPLERLIAGHLEQAAARVDAAALAGRVRAALAAPVEIVPAVAPPVVGRRFLPRVRWGMALAASLVLLLLATLSWTPSTAQAESLVRSAEAKQRLAVDRCYSIRTEILGDFRERFPLLHQTGYERIHTRGSRFWVEARKQEPKLPLVRPGFRWGRDEHGRYWLALSARIGLRFEPEEAPEALRFFIAVRGADLDAILGGLLADFQLNVDRAGSSPELTRIGAVLKPGRPQGTLRAAELAIRKADGELEELTLHREFLRQPLARIHLAREADQPQPDANYRLETHLLTGAVIFDQRQASKRNELFRTLLRDLQKRPGDGAR